MQIIETVTNTQLKIVRVFTKHYHFHFSIYTGSSHLRKYNLVLPGRMLGRPTRPRRLASLAQNPILRDDQPSCEAYEHHVVLGRCSQHVTAEHRCSGSVPSFSFPLTEAQAERTASGRVGTRNAAPGTEGTARSDMRGETVCSLRFKYFR
jgi:hypothetical protein